MTGGAGKLGRWVVDALASHGHDILVFDRVVGESRANIRYIVGDIRDYGQVIGAVAGADAIVHLAGIPTHSVVANELTFAINTGGTFNVHEAAWRLGVPRVVTMSSEAVLGWAPGAWTHLILPEYLPLDEEHPTRPQDAYGLSKVVCEEIARSYHLKCGMEAIALRPPWIVDPDELAAMRSSNGIIPTRFALFHYVDVRDVADACRLALSCKLSGFEAAFLGSGESSVAEPLSTLYPRLAPEIGSKAAALTGRRSSVSVEKARRLLNWQPKHSWRFDPT